MIGRLPDPFRKWMEKFFSNPLLRRVVKNSAYLFSATGLAAAIGMLQGILTARLLGVANYGILGAIIVFTSVINRFASFRMSELVVRYVGEFEEQGNQRHSAALFKAAALVEMAASLVAFGLIWALSPLGARWLAKDSATVHWFALYGWIVIANLIAESSTGLLQIFDRFRRLAWLQVAGSLVTLTFIALAYFARGGLGAVLWAYILGKSVGALGFTWAALREATHRWGKGWWNAPLNLLRPKWGELARFAISTNISASLSLINKDSELLWISFLRNPLETGYYKLALSLVNIVQMPISPLPQTTYPELSRQMARGEWKSVRALLRQGSLLAGGYTLAAAVGLAVLGKPLIRVLYTDPYLPAYPALMILLLGFLVANTFYWHRPALLAIGRAEFPAQVNFGLAILKICGIFWLVPKYGYLANAALLSASYLLGVGISVVVFGITLRRRASRVAPQGTL
ncbi:MAG: lipopolysaccharide biosynthesis protein [Anaerolineales bacterium]